MQTEPTPGQVADAMRDNWVDRYAPAGLRPFARMARWDRPIGFWLLFWPCALGVGLVFVTAPERGIGWWHLVLFLVGAIAMRGAGCTFNDIVDRDIDAQVARTRSRPLPSGQVSVRQALAFLIVQALVGLLVLVQFNLVTILLGIGSLMLVAIYPFMKRITFWPQLFLGLCFSWGALLGWTAAFGALGPAPVLLYLGCIAWVIGYDTLYALQDIEDDALIGVKSTALLFGPRAPAMVALFYALALLLWLGAGLAAGGGFVLGLGLAAPALLLCWQVVTLRPQEDGNCLTRFKANHWVGLLASLALVAEGVF